MQYLESIWAPFKVLGYSHDRNEAVICDSYFTRIGNSLAIYWNEDRDGRTREKKGAEFKRPLTQSDQSYQEPITSPLSVGQELLKF